MGISLSFEGYDIEEKGIVDTISGDLAPAIKKGDVIIQVDPRYFRPTEVETLLGNASKAKNQLGWEPEITAQEMCYEIINHDLSVAKRHALLKIHGYELPLSFE